jgi:hypothetical protein
MTWVWDHSLSEGNDRLVLLAIADQCDDSGRQAWPTYERLMQKTRIASRTTISACLSRLQERGELKVEKFRDEKRKTTRNSYTLPTYQQAIGQSRSWTAGQSSAERDGQSSGVDSPSFNKRPLHPKDGSKLSTEARLPEWSEERARLLEGLSET